jgi:type VI secretion system secreted protein Hcp
MAESVHLFMKANGEDVKGESTMTSLGRGDSIECVSFGMGAHTTREAGSGRAVARRQYEPVVVRKRIDKASPLLAKALCNNEVIEGVFKFYRPNPLGDGTTEQFYTVEIKNARVSDIRIFNPDTIEPGSSSMPGMEEVSFHFGRIIWTITDGGISHEDSWDENR